VLILYPNMAVIDNLIRINDKLVKKLDSSSKYLSLCGIIHYFSVSGGG